jgi:hypothetical protein
MWTHRDLAWNYWSNYQWEEAGGQHCAHVVAYAYYKWRKVGRLAA